jgi:hypothetical protein
MSIRLEMRRAQICPRIFCDVCHGPIEGSGNVVCAVGTNDSLEAPIFVHKACDGRRPERRQRLEFWMDIDRFLTFLTSNTLR